MEQRPRSTTSAPSSVAPAANASKSEPDETRQSRPTAIFLQPRNVTNARAMSRTMPSVISVP